MISLFRDIDKSFDFTASFLDINGQDYQLYHNGNNLLPEYDITVDPPPPGQYSCVKYRAHLQLDLWDNYENQGWRNEHQLKILDPEMYIISNAWDPCHINPQIIYNDFLFNRTKAYYEHYEFSPNARLWYYIGQHAYSVPEQDANLKTRIFISPNKTWPNTWRRLHFRTLIFERLVRSMHLGHIGNCQVDPAFFLIPHVICPDINDIRDLSKIPNRAQLVENSLTANRFGYSPPHDVYYQDTFISIYGESIEYGTSIAPTEKTYDPLIKGHFVLPFSCAGFVGFLKNKGFRFPDFIDYSYDDELDDVKRCAMYLAEVDRLLDIRLEDWQQLWINCFHIRSHNQKIFLDSPYDRVDLYQFIQN